MGTETHRAKASGLALALAAVMALAAGCGPTRGPDVVGPAEVLSPGAVLMAHNAWADSIQHIWSRTALMLNIPTDDPNNRRLKADLDGHLFLEKPERLFIHGDVVGQEVFKVGMNAEKFWLWVRPKVNTVWTGARNGPGERRFIISPADLMAALGLFRVEPGSDSLAMFVAQDRHYVFSEDRIVAGRRRVPWRRLWFDRRTLRLARVDLYDDVGRRVLMAELMHYEPVDRTSVCTVYRARFFGDEEVDLVLRLSAVRLDKPPNPKVFEYRLPPGAKEENLDTN